MEGPLEDITGDEVRTAMQKLKSGKAARTSKVTSEMFITADDVGLDILMEVFKNSVRVDAPPEKWARSITVPL